MDFDGSSPQVYSSVSDSHQGVIGAYEHSMNCTGSPPAVTDAPGGWNSSLYSLVRNSARKGPWNPVSGSNQSFDLRYGDTTNTYPSHLNNALSSDCGRAAHGNPPSDSGYGSAPKQSVGNASVYDELDRSAETQSISSQFLDRHFPGGKEQGIGSWDSGDQSRSISDTAKPNAYVCEHCGEGKTTRSDLTYSYLLLLSKHTLLMTIRQETRETKTQETQLL